MVSLSSIRAYLIDHGPATRDDLAIACDAEPEAVGLVLDQWIARGKIRRSQGGGCCGSSGSACHCSTPPAEVFSWEG